MSARDDTPLHSLLHEACQAFVGGQVGWDETGTFVARDLNEFQTFLTSQLTPAPNVASVKSAL